MKSATMYERDRKLYLHSLSDLTSGVLMLVPPIIALERGQSAALGRAIVECLTASRPGVEPPESAMLGRLFDPVLKLAGVKSFRKFSDGAKAIQINMVDGERVIFTATRKMADKSGGGFVRIEGSEKTSLFNNEADLAAAALEVLALSE